MTDYSEPGPYPVGIIELTLTDPSRPIEQTREHASAPERVLQTRIYYPAASASILGEAPPVASEGAPFPMLMYSHGYSSNWDESKPAGNHAASYGYLVVSPIFPLTSLGAKTTASRIRRTFPIRRAISRS
jgi:predicted dienelactone hydrolase